MRVFFTFCLVLLGYVAFSQRYAVVSGDWNGPIWASTPGGAAGSAATPTASDDVYTNGQLVEITSNVQCNNLNVSFDVTNSITFPNDDVATITINGYLTGFDDLGASEVPPVQPDVMLLGENQTLLFLGAGQKIYLWRHATPLSNVTFNPGVGNDIDLGSGFRVDNFGVIRIQSGQLAILSSSTNAEIRGCADCILRIDAGTTLDTRAAINGGTTSTRIGNVTLNGTLITSNYINANDFDMGAAGVLQTSFSGANQTQGWWRTTTSPSTGTINVSSTIEFNALAAQNFQARNYGHLILGGSGTKTLVGTGSLNVQGNFTIENADVIVASSNTSGLTFRGNISNNGTWTTTQPVTFTGTAAQSIEGDNVINLNGGFTVNKASNSLTLNRDVNVAGGFTVTLGTFAMANYNLTLNGGNITNNGTINAGASTLRITGTTTLGGSSTTTLNNLTIDASGNFTAPTVLQISGNLISNGTFNAGSGALTFNGTDQSISGTINVNNVNISSTGTQGVSLNGNMNLNGALTLTSAAAKFNAIGSGSGILTVRSTGVNSGGRIAALPSTTNFTGAVTVQRFVNGPDTWRYFSMPITNGNVAMWQDDFPVTGNFSNRSPVGVDGVENNTAPSIYSFNPVTNQYVAVGSGGTTDGTPLSNAIGYSAYSYKTGDFTISVRGSIGKGNIPVSVSTANGGYNLVPNPYPSAIDWDNVTKTGLNDALWIRVANNQYASYVGGVAANGPFVGWSGEIATGQSFWVQSTGATSLTFKEADKTSNQYEFLRELAPQDYIRVTLASATQSDETVVRFASDAGENFDSPYDARKKKNGDYSSTLQRYTYLNLSSYVSDPSQDYAINGIGTLSECSRNVKLKVEDVSAGDYKLKFSDLDKMYLDYDVILIDNYLNHEFPVVEGAEYNFAVTTDASSKGASRFELSFVAQSIRNVGSDATAQNCGPGRMILDVTGAPDGGSYRWYESADASEPIPNETSSSFTTPMLTESTTYFVSVVNGNGCESVLRFPVQAKVVNIDRPVISLNGNVLSVNEGTGIQWYKDDVPIDGATTNQLELSESGVYKATTTLDGCTAESDGIEFRVTGVEDEKSSYAFFPNPAADYLQITGPLEGADVEFYDSSGRNVPAQIAEADEHQIILDLRQVKEGLYFLNLRKKNKVVQRKVLKK